MRGHTYGSTPMTSKAQRAVWGTLLLGAFAVGCASSNTATRGVDVEGPRVASGEAAGADGMVMPKINSRAQLLFEDANKAFAAQRKTGNFNFPQLEAKYQAALAADERLAEANYNLGVLAERQGKKDEAAKHYRDALRKKPTLKQAAENLAVMEQNAGNISAAANTYQQILESYPDDASSRARLAELARQQGDQERALELARQSLMREPRTLGAYKVMMLSYLDRKQLQMAKLVALRALKIDENDPELYHTIGLVLLAEGEATKARAQFEKAVQVRKDYQPSHVQLAKLALQTEDYSGAEEHLRAILQTGGRSAEVFVNLGVAYKGMGQYDKAMQAYDEAEKMNPDLAPIYLNRGIILHRHKAAPDRGLQMYEKYLALAGGDAGIGGDSVYKLIEEARGVIAAKEEERRALEEAARMEKEMAAQQKAAEAAAKGNAAGNALHQAAPAAGSAAGETQPAAAASPKKAPQAKSSSRAAQRDEPSDEPGDEPADDM